MDAEPTLRNAEQPIFQSSPFKIDNCLMESMKSSHFLEEVEWDLFTASGTNF